MNQTNYLRVAVGLSGGVDSAVSAALLLEQGYEITGVFMVCYRGPGCRTDEDRKDALDTAMKLGIPFEVMDFRKAYREKVLQYFKAEYTAGRTPNPDVMCNREIKFGLFYQEMIKKRGFDYIATGHYARIQEFSILNSQFSINDSIFKLLKSKDERKDQTYFLYQLREDQLKHILFPVGGMTKAEVRRKAEELELPVAKKPDSQGICFVGEVSVNEFLYSMGVKEERGEVVDVNGKVIGWHKGAGFYTIGQRHGFSVETQSNKTEPLFVVEKVMKENRLVVGNREACMRQEFEVDSMHWIDDKAPKRLSDRAIEVRIRHGGELVRVNQLISESVNQKSYKVKLDKKIFGVAAGQSAVFYKEGVCLGGGVIVR